jgi:hypothetical protein
MVGKMQNCWEPFCLFVSSIFQVETINNFKVSFQELNIILQNMSTNTRKDKNEQINKNTQKP